MFPLLFKCVDRKNPGIPFFIISKESEIEIVVNGKTESISHEIDLLSWLEGKGIGLDGLVVMMNDEIVRKEARQTVMIKANDVIEVLNFVSGG
ncbi:MAG: sulfur carrier protein ThiS [Sulfurimonas sp.]